MDAKAQLQSKVCILYVIKLLYDAMLNKLLSGLQLLLL